jgi:hypothetical protein
MRRGGPAEPRSPLRGSRNLQGKRRSLLPGNATGGECLAAGPWCRIPRGPAAVPRRETGGGPGEVASRVRRYIRGQEEHHAQVSFRDELIALLKKHRIPYDEKYLLG